MRWNLFYKIKIMQQFFYDSYHDDEDDDDDDCITCISFSAYTNASI